MDWYERRPSEYKEDTWHLSLAEHGAYNLLLDHYYANEKPLPNQDRALASICNCSSDEWATVKENVLKFFKVKENRLHKRKCDTILNAAFKRRKDGALRAKQYRKSNALLSDDSPPGNGSTGQDRTGQDNTGQKVEYMFDEFYNLYPEKTSKKAARVKYKKIIKDGTATHDEIMAGVTRYNAFLALPDNAYRKPRGPVVWLNNENWNDELDMTQKPKGGATGFNAVALKLAGEG